MQIDRTNIKEIVETTGIRPDKDYGQNFLLEPEVCKRIVDTLEINDNDKVLEIGPGLGSLTHFLSLTNSDVTLVDIDRRMIDYLLVVYNANSNVKIVENDIRKHDVNSYTKILGNLPYNITTETVLYLLKNAVNADKMVLMCQSEAFNRFFDLSGENYGPASILVRMLGTPKKLFVVKPGSFYPAPKCNSTVFEITIDKSLDRELAIKVYEFSKQLFLNRRKTISNNLNSLVKNKEIVEKVLTKLAIAPNKRPEELTPNIYIELFKELKNK